MIAKDTDQIERAFQDLYWKLNDSDRSSDHKLEEIVSIEWVAVYKTPLEGIYSDSPKIIQDTFGIQWTQVDYHAFVAVNTSDGFYWSIEKQQDGIHINRKTNLAEVRDQFGSRHRKPPVECLIETTKTSCSLIRLTDIIKKEKEGYYFRDNCHHLAKRLFDKIASSDTWEFTSPPEYICWVIIVFLLSTTCLLATHIFWSRMRA